MLNNMHVISGLSNTVPGKGSLLPPKGSERVNHSLKPKWQGPALRGPPWLLHQVTEVSLHFVSNQNKINIQVYTDYKNTLTLFYTNED